jgi:hypothetical protein
VIRAIRVSHRKAKGATCRARARKGGLTDPRVERAPEVVALASFATIPITSPRGLFPQVVRPFLLKLFAAVCVLDCAGAATVSTTPRWCTDSSNAANVPKGTPCVFPFTHGGQYVSHMNIDPSMPLLTTHYSLLTLAAATISGTAAAAISGTAAAAAAITGTAAAAITGTAAAAISGTTATAISGTAAAAVVAAAVAAKNLSQPPLRRLLKRQLSQRSVCRLHSVL